MRVDRINGSFIGKGEDPTKEFLKNYFELPEYNSFIDWKNKKEGIYPQVPIPWLLNKNELKNLREDHSKSSVDLVVLLSIDTTLCVRVQGKGHGEGQKGWSKSRFDSIQERMLENSGHVVINIYYRDCQVLFKKDILNEKSKKEIIESFKFKFPLE